MGFTKGALLVLGTALAVVWIPSLLKPKRPVVIGGFALPKWKKVERVFRERIEKGLIRGGSFAVYHEGKPVVNLFGGYADEESLIPWTKDTISPYFSTTKGIVAICLAILADRGHLDYDQPVIKYWPEFGENGKEKITVRQLLSHQAGLIAFPEVVRLSTLLEDPERVFALAARAIPQWKLGNGHGYHAISIGIYMDALLRKCDPKQRNLTKFFDDEIRKPLVNVSMVHLHLALRNSMLCDKVRRPVPWKSTLHKRKFYLAGSKGVDIYIGPPRSEYHRVARFTQLSAWEKMKGVLANPGMFSVYGAVVFGNKDHPLVKCTHTFREFHEDTFNPNNPSIGEVPFASGLGFGTASAAAKIWGAVANDGKIDGKVIMKPDTVKILSEPVISGLDKVLGFNTSMGLGTNHQVSPEGNYQAGHPGTGGQMAFMDHKRKLAWGYFTNFQAFNMIADDYAALTAAMYDSLE